MSLAGASGRSADPPSGAGWTTLIASMIAVQSTVGSLSHRSRLSHTTVPPAAVASAANCVSSDDLPEPAGPQTTVTGAGSSSIACSSRPRRTAERGGSAGWNRRDPSVADPGSGRGGLAGCNSTRCPSSLDSVSDGALGRALTPLSPVRGSLLLPFACGGRRGEHREPEHHTLRRPSVPGQVRRRSNRPSERRHGSPSGWFARPVLLRRGPTSPRRPHATG
jgi:hypothetical protein